MWELLTLRLASAQGLAQAGHSLAFERWSENVLEGVKAYVLGIQRVFWWGYF